jgi:hypothetical protein
MKAYREIYLYENGNSPITSGTNLNPLLGFEGSMYAQTAHMFLNGVRSVVTITPLTGEFYVMDNTIYNAIEIEPNSTLMLEIIKVIE